MEILIAEDDKTSLLLLKTILTKWGYEVTAVTNGKDAETHLLNSNTPKLALIDWMMPDKDGIEVCHTLQKQKHPVPHYIILVTSKAKKKDIAKGLDSGADDYIVKPYDHVELKARINVGQRIISMQNVMAQKEKFKGVIEMSGAICHEINQPLMVITGYSEILLMDIQKDDPQYNMLNKINGQAHRIGEITKKLMRITKYKTKAYLKTNIIDINEASEGKKQ